MKPKTLLNERKGAKKRAKKYAQFSELVKKKIYFVRKRRKQIFILC